ncbi:MAG: molybdopterin-dependent oxidoreductase [Mycobacteriales bacterium]
MPKIRLPRIRIPLRGITGALCGIIATAFALGIAELVAALVRPQASPVITVGQSVIDATPTPVKEWAIAHFGFNDKLVLQSGILVILAIFAAIVGVIAVRRLLFGVIGVAIFGVVAIAAAASRPVAQLLDVLPAIAAAAAGAIALVVLVRALHRADLVSKTATLAGDTESDTASSDNVAKDSKQPQPESEQPGQSEHRELRSSPSRRSLLIAGSVFTGAAIATESVGRWLQGVLYNARASREAVKLPVPVDPAPPIPAGADLKLSGVTSYVTPNSTFYKVDTTLVVPQVRTQDWQLRIHGMVSEPITFSFDELLKLPMIERMITMTCVSNEVGDRLVGNATWLGVALGPLLKQRGISRKADQLVCRSVDGMTIGAPLAAIMDGRDALLAVGMNGEPLPFNNGFPARVVVPGLYGYCSACKWVVDMEATTFNAYDAYWVQRDWAKVAPIKASARIETPQPLSSQSQGRINVSGVAWAQHNGISKVEVKIDDGPWQQAELGTAMSKDVWRQWVYRWDAPPGFHRITARATDGDGQLQTADRAKPFPNGSSGWHNIVVTIE